MQDKHYRVTSVFPTNADPLVDAASPHEQSFVDPLGSSDCESCHRCVLAMSTVSEKSDSKDRKEKQQTRRAAGKKSDPKAGHH